MTLDTRNSLLTSPEFVNYSMRVKADQGERFAVVVRFEDCLCTGVDSSKRGNIIKVRRKGKRIERTNMRSQTHQFAIEKRYSPVALETAVSRMVSALRWRHRATWFLRSVSRESSIKIFILSDYPDIVVRKKLGSIIVNTQIVGSSLKYDPKDGLYSKGFDINYSVREDFIDKLVKSQFFEQVVVVGARNDDFSTLSKSTGIYIGSRPWSSAPSQFTVKNFMEVFATIKVIFGALPT